MMLWQQSHSFWLPSLVINASLILSRMNFILAHKSAIVNIRRVHPTPAHTAIHGFTATAYHSSTVSTQVSVRIQTVAVTTALQITATFGAVSVFGVHLLL